MPDALPPPVVGDPAGMRALAAALRAEADRLGSLGGSIADGDRMLAYEGPAADGFRDRMGGVETSLSAQAFALLDLSRRLLSAAADVEQAQQGGSR